MKYLLMTVTMMFSAQNAFADLSEALTAAIQTSDKEKSNTKIALSVADEHIEKATFKKGQVQVIKEESSVMVESLPYQPEASHEEEVEDVDSQGLIKQELSDIK